MLIKLGIKAANFVSSVVSRLAYGGDVSALPARAVPARASEAGLVCDPSLYRLDRGVFRT